MSRIELEARARRLSVAFGAQYPADLYAATMSETMHRELARAECNPDDPCPWCEPSLQCHVCGMTFTTSPIGIAGLASHTCQ